MLPPLCLCAEGNHTCSFVPAQVEELYEQQGKLGLAPKGPTPKGKEQQPHQGVRVRAMEFLLSPSLWLFTVPEERLLNVQENTVMGRIQTTVGLGYGERFECSFPAARRWAAAAAGGGAAAQAAGARFGGTFVELKRVLLAGLRELVSGQHPAGTWLPQLGEGAKPARIRFQRCGGSGAGSGAEAYRFVVSARCRPPSPASVLRRCLDFCCHCRCLCWRCCCCCAGLHQSSEAGAAAAFQGSC